MSLTFRPVESDASLPRFEEDARFLLDVRNDAETRAVSRNSECVAWSSHVIWLTATLRDPREHLYIVMRGGENVGTFRLTRIDDGLDEAEIHMALHPAFRGQK